jgi:prostaglandin-endoperoxide synthase 2
MPDWLPYWIQELLFGAIGKWPWAASKVNAWIINKAVNACPHRPHPWSTASDYVSWTSLSDKRWSARHLPAFHRVPPATPAALVAMFRRPDGAQRLSAKSTCLFPAFAQYLTDGFIRTRMPKKSLGEDDSVRLQNTSNHEIDLCTLYGRLPEQTAQLRLKSTVEGRKGRLISQLIGGEEYPPFLLDQNFKVKPTFDTLDDPLGLNDIPPGPDGDKLREVIFATGGDRVNSAPQVAMMNTLFLREHNRLAGMLETQNPDWDDEHVFQVARNIVIVVFLKMVVEEYINHIMPLPFRLTTDPSVAWNAPWNKPNWITTEFSLLYRWHSLIPDIVRWSDIDYPCDNTFLNNRLLLASGLANAFVELSAQKAGELGAFNTAERFLISVEQSAIMQGQLCNVAPYVHYRDYMGLSVPDRFEDITSNPETLAFLKNAYRTPADIDFYVGLFAEEPIANSPLPPLMLAMVAVDAFSQALTNPLLSEHVFNPDTFTPLGWDVIQNTGSIRDILARNAPGGIGNAIVTMTQQDWVGR